MDKQLSQFTKKQALVYKVFLFVAATLLIIYLLPKGGQFKYDFQKGKPWMYENLYAPFSFTIKKSEETLEAEKQEIRKSAIPYFDYDSAAAEQAAIRFQNLLNENYADSIYRIPKSRLSDIGNEILDEVNTHGFTQEIQPFDPEQLVYLKNGNQVEEIAYNQIIKSEDLKDRLERMVHSRTSSENGRELLGILLNRALTPTVTYNSKLTEAAIASEIEAINPNRGIIEKGGRIIARGEVVEGDTFQILNSLKLEYQSQVWSKSNLVWLLVGYSMLVSLVFLMLFLFLKKYRSDIYYNNTKVTFIFFNIVLMVFLTTVVVKLDAAFVYVVPLCILPVSYTHLTLPTIYSV